MATRLFVTMLKIHIDQRFIVRRTILLRRTIFWVSLLSGSVRDLQPRSPWMFLSGAL